MEPDRADGATRQQARLYLQQFWLRHVLQQTRRDLRTLRRQMVRLRREVRPAEPPPPPPPPPRPAAAVCARSTARATRRAGSRRPSSRSAVSAEPGEPPPAPPCIAPVRRSGRRTSTPRPGQSRRKNRAPGLYSLAAHGAVLAALMLCRWPLPDEPQAIHVATARADTLAEPLIVELDAMQQLAPLPEPAELAAAAPLRAEPVSSDLLVAASRAALPAAAGIPAADAIDSSLVGQWVSTSAAGPAGAPSLFGISEPGRRLVFIVDSSGSMADGRLDRAKRELRQAIASLQSWQRFHVIFYDQNLEHSPLAGGSAERPQLVACTPAHLSRLDQWLQTIQTEPGRPPLDALHAAIAMLPDAVFLFSDGDFPEWVLPRVRQSNVLDDVDIERRPLVTIHAVAVLKSASEANRARVERMRRLAEENGGGFRQVVWH